MRLQSGRPLEGALEPSQLENELRDSHTYDGRHTTSPAGPANRRATVGGGSTASVACIVPAFLPPRRRPARCRPSRAVTGSASGRSLGPAGYAVSATKRVGWATRETTT